MSGNDLEVHEFRNDEDEVPESVQNLIIYPSAQEVPSGLCRNYTNLRKVTLLNGLYSIGENAFEGCENLLEIRICNTMMYIKAGTFKRCRSLAKVEFETSASSQHQLRTIEQWAFASCVSLERIELPPSVTSVGEHAYFDCNSLVEANLSTTGITHVSDRAFCYCSALQTVGLPNTVTRIYSAAFSSCLQLVTVVVPKDSQPLLIDDLAFISCFELVNLQIPEGSGAMESAFYQCHRLEKCYVRHGPFSGLIYRFFENPIHLMCYDHATTSVQQLRQCVADNQAESWDGLVDEFGMTPFHVLFSTLLNQTSLDLLDVLLDSLPDRIILLQDNNDKNPLDYLINNWTDIAASLFRKTLQKFVDRLARWGATTWMEVFQTKVDEVFAADSTEVRSMRWQEAYSLLEKYEILEASSILEMALWKWKIKSGWTSDGAKRRTLDRQECRHMSGSDVVIPNVSIFLHAASEDDSIDADPDLFDINPVDIQRLLSNMMPHDIQRLFPNMMPHDGPLESDSSGED